MTNGHYNTVLRSRISDIGPAGARIVRDNPLQLLFLLYNGTFSLLPVKQDTHKGLDTWTFWKSSQPNQR